VRGSQIHAVPGFHKELYAETLKEHLCAHGASNNRDAQTPSVVHIFFTLSWAMSVIMAWGAIRT